MEGGRPVQVVGLVENPLNLQDEFALMAPGQIASPASVSILLNAGQQSLESFRLPDGNGIGISQRSSAGQAAAEAIVLVMATIGLLFVGLLAVAGFAVMAQRRLRALGMLGSLGATDRHVRLVMLANGAAVGATASVVGAVVGLVVWFAFAPLMQSIVEHRINRFALPWWAVGATLVLALCHRGHRRLVAGPQRSPDADRGRPLGATAPPPTGSSVRGGGRPAARDRDRPARLRRSAPAGVHHRRHRRHRVRAALPRSPRHPGHRRRRRPAGRSPSAWPGGTWPDTRPDRGGPRGRHPGARHRGHHRHQRGRRPDSRTPLRICPPTSWSCTSATAHPVPAIPIPVVSGAGQQSSAGSGRSAREQPARPVGPSPGGRLRPGRPARDRSPGTGRRSRRARSPHRSATGDRRWPTERTSIRYPPLYVATPALLERYGIQASSINPAADVISSRSDLAGLQIFLPGIGPTPERAASGPPQHPRRRCTRR